MEKEENEKEEKEEEERKEEEAEEKTIGEIVAEEGLVTEPERESMLKEERVPELSEIVMRLDLSLIHI